MAGKHHSPETKAKLAESLKTYFRVHGPRKGGKLSPESIEKLSKSHKERFKSSPEALKQLSDNAKKQFALLGHPGRKSVLCVTTNTVYTSVKEAAEKCGVSKESVRTSALCDSPEKPFHRGNPSNLIFEYCKEEDKHTYWVGKKHSNETIKKMSEAQKGKEKSIEQRRKMSEAHKILSKGEINPNAKLTEEDVNLIRYYFAMGGTYKILSKEFGVTPGMIGHIIHRRMWRHI